TLGHDFFQRRPVEVDYARQRLLLHEPGTFAPAGCPWFAVDTSRRIPLIEAVLEVREGVAFPRGWWWTWAPPRSRSAWRPRTCRSMPPRSREFAASKLPSAPASREPGGRGGPPARAAPGQLDRPFPHRRARARHEQRARGRAVRRQHRRTGAQAV